MEPQTVAASFARIRRWLQAHAPQIAAAIPPGASEQQVAQAERRMSTPLPDDVREFYRQTAGGDGCSLFPSLAPGEFAYDVISIEHLNEYLRDTSPGEEYPTDDEVRPAEWRKKWIPIATNGAGDYQCIDLDPAKRGTKGQMIECLHETCERLLIAPSVALRLEELADGLEAGRYIVDEQGEITAVEAGRPSRFQPPLPEPKPPFRLRQVRPEVQTTHPVQVVIWCRTRVPDDHDDPAFQATCAALQAGLAQVSGSPAQVGWDGAHCYTADATVIGRVQEWALRELVPQGLAVSWGARIWDYAEHVVHARWVELSCYSDDVDDDVVYPLACEVCRWRDFGAVPSPFPVSREILRGPNAGREIFPAGNGVYIVTTRVRDLFAQLIPGEFVHGPAEVRNRPDANGRYHWIRPVASTGGRVDQIEEQPCRACGRPTAIRKRPNALEGYVVSSYGDPRLSFALYGPYRWRQNSERPTAAWHRSVVSGPLFALLYNLGIKGLCWPDNGPIVSAEGEPPLVPRRFAQYFTARQDKALQHTKQY